MLFVGTKKQAGDSVREEAERAGVHYVNARWLGGMLTNFKTIRRRIERLKQLRKMEEDGTFDRLPKKEVIKLNLEIEKLEKFLGGIQTMNKLPGALFVVDPRKEKIAVSEAKKLGIPVVAIVDTNCDPDESRLCHPWQRRCHPCSEADCSDHGRCDHRGQTGRSRKQPRMQQKKLSPTLNNPSTSQEMPGQFCSGIFAIFL